MTAFALVRFAEDGDWFAGCPVVLDFDGVQVEVCHWKLDELSIGWETIDTAATITGWEPITGAGSVIAAAGGSSRRRWRRTGGREYGS